MSDSANISSYDRVPYRSKPRRSTHPDAAATLARLMGLAPAPIARCRVLEIGCGTGGNLHAMAWPLPGSQFLGIDPSPVQIQIARDEARDLRISNVQFEAIGIGDLPADSGPFDYILCHGVFSWVPPSIQDQILAACRTHLAPQGIAMVSYNTYPGWHARAACRDAMNFHVRDIDDATEKTRQARGYLQFLTRSVADPQSALARMLTDELEIVNTRDDYYVFHEHLEETNAPCYFHEFNSRARGHGLQYLGESARARFLIGLSDETQQTLQRISRDLIDLEQHVDFLRNCAFRHTLLVRDDVDISRVGSPERLDGLLARSAANTDPVPRRVPLSTNVSYRSTDGVSISTASPLMNAVLFELLECWPEAIPLTELKRRVAARFVEELPAEMLEIERLFPKAIFDLYESTFLTLHSWQPEFLRQATARPEVWPVGRAFGRVGSIVPTLTHQCIDASPFACFVLSHCDGTRDVAALTALAGAIREGRLPAIDGDVATAVRESLAMIANCAILIG